MKFVIKFFIAVVIANIIGLWLWQDLYTPILPNKWFCSRVKTYADNYWVVQYSRVGGLFYNNAIKYYYWDNFPLNHKSTMPIITKDINEAKQIAQNLCPRSLEEHNRKIQEDWDAKMRARDTIINFQCDSPN